MIAFSGFVSNIKLDHISFERVLAFEEDLMRTDGE